MDSVRARALADELVGNTVGPWIIQAYINSGRSAAVFKAASEGRIAAVKVFDRELVERFGEPVQLARIERELLLRGHEHPNLVEILDGGRCGITGYLYVAMNYLPDRNMADLLQSIPRDRIAPLIAQVAAAAHFLEDLGLAHRDIKPDNIAISADYEHATLLDLGVLKPTRGIGNITDEDQPMFIGTLRYSPPEYLVREEEENPEAWRAITFYQLGAVLHDLVMKQRLHEGSSEPFARLVEAVRQDPVTVAAADVPEDLVLLARNCLVKDPALRLRCVRWSDFAPKPNGTSTVEAAKDRIRRRLAAAEAGPRSPREHEVEERRREKQRTLRAILDGIRGAVLTECLSGDLPLPPVTVQESQREPDSDTAAFCVAIAASGPRGLYEPVYLFFGVTLERASEDIVLVRFAAHLGGDQPNSDPPPERMARVFEGVYGLDVVREKVKAVFYPVLDRAMERAEARRDTPAISAEEWLNVAEEARGQ
jgi:eukaryotic-like serine/threonine-protein kinase